MKHILFITSQDLWGESDYPQRSPGRTLKGYIDAGYKVSIISTQPRNKNYKQLCVDGYYPVPYNSRPIKKYPQLLKIIINSIIFPIISFFLGIFINIRSKVDLVYGYEVQGVLAGKLLSFALRKPLISRFQGVAWYHLIKNKSFITQIKYIDHYLSYYIPADLTIMTNDGTNGDDVLKKIRKNIGRMVFWRNGVNSPYNENVDDLREIYNINTKKTIIMIACRLVKWKSVDRAISMIHCLRDNTNAALFILGDGPERINLERMTNKLNLKERVFFMGDVPQLSVMNYMNQADIFLSLYDISNVGNPLLEALRCGLALITIDVGDTGSLISDNENGILLPHWDLNMATQKLQMLLEDKDIRKRLSTSAFNYSKENLWTWNERINTEIELVESFL